MADVAAIIGLAGRFPGEVTVETLWSRLSSGQGPLADGLGREPWMSRVRLFLECATEALENASCASRLDAERTGLFLAGTEGDTLASDAAGDLGLSGPTLTVPGDSALAAVERACRGLGSGECDLALAGEVPTRGEWAGVVALKRLPHALADGDRILGVIRGSAVHALEPPPPAVPRIVGSPGGLAEPPHEPGAVRERPPLASAYNPPGNHLEAAIAAVWQEQLGIDRVGVDDNFFELGGTSIAGVKIIALLKEWLHQDIPTVSLYEGPTVSALARILLHTGPAKGYDAVRERGERRRRKLQRLGHAARQDSVE